MLHCTTAIILATAWFTLLLPSVHAGWVNNIQPRASGRPSCTAVCTEYDNTGIGINYSQSSDNGVVVCDYLAPEDADGVVLPNSCNYGASTGSFISGTTYIDHCPASIPVSNCSPVKRSTVTKRNTIAARPQPAAVPLNMRSLTALKKSKLAVRNPMAFEAYEEK
ncbi:hypothetical protein FRB95_006112 [Tulasnella sp. JGI-2019a]|nr:hypothetical protein FRB95_006112 [Tulasnella sp. JGI-2019a]